MPPISCGRRRFLPVIIRHAVGSYLRITLSHRLVEDLPAARGLEVSYETVRRWVLRFGPAIVWRLRQRRPKPSARRHLDEMEVRIGGERMCLQRAVDDEGEVPDTLVQRRWNTTAARTLRLRHFEKQGSAPNVVAIEKLRSYAVAFAGLGLSARR